MVGKHSRQAPGHTHLQKQTGSRLVKAWIGARELFVFAAVGIVAPIAMLVAFPQLLDSGQAMLHASACSPSVASTRDCLDARPAELLSPAANATWELRVGEGRTAELSFPSEQIPDPKGELRVLYWNGEPVAVLEADGDVAGGLRWGRLHGVSTQALLVAPLWPLAVITLAFLILWQWQSHRLKLVLLAVVGFAAAVAGPSAYLGMRIAGYTGLVRGAVIPLGLALLLDGLLLLIARRGRYMDLLRPERRLDGRLDRLAPPRTLVPAQRTTPPELGDVMAPYKVTDRFRED